MQAVGAGLVVDGRAVLAHGAVQVSLRVETGHLFGRSKLGHRLLNRSHVDVRYLDALVVLQLQLVTDDLWRSFDRKRLLGAALAFGLAHDGGVFLGTGIFLTAKKIVVILLRHASTAICLEVWTVLSQQSVDGGGAHQLAADEQLVDLFDEVKGRILLVEDERVDVVDDDGNLSLLEEEL